MAVTAELPDRFGGTLRVAIVGAGPAGFYAAGALFKQKGLDVRVDMFEKLPAPYGLVRYGVAPDHYKIKTVTKVYAKTAVDPRFRFFGNVTYGQDISLEELKRYYDQIIFTVGAQSDKKLFVPGEDLDGSHSAREFVNWYNGHPDYSDRSFDLSHSAAVVVGVGNVALDVARILAKTPAELETTDITDYTLDALRDSQIRDIYVLARRGPAQVKFTNHEIREFCELKDATPVTRPIDFEFDPHSRALVESSSGLRRNVDVLRSFAEETANETSRRVHFLFQTSPVEVIGENCVEGMVVRRNELMLKDDGYLQAEPTEETHVIDCGLILRSVGYRGEPLADLPFDGIRGRIPNQDGRVVDPDSGTKVAGVYVAGWIKRGPSGVIGTNKPDAVETVHAMFADLAGLDPCPERASGVETLLSKRGVDFVDFARWQRINAAEIEAAAGTGRPRLKRVTRSSLLEV